MFKFLTKLTITSYLVRTKILARKEWIEHKLPEPKEVILIGKRTLQNGRKETDYYPYEGAVNSYFVPDEYIKAFLVVENMNENPFYILPSSIDTEKTYNNQNN